MKSVNPYTGELIRDYEEYDKDTVRQRIEACRDSQRPWGRLSVGERLAFLPALIEALEERGDELARLITREMGKPIRQSRAELEKCGKLCRYYMKEGEKILSDQPLDSSGSKAYVSYQPLGLVFGVMPWNFPFWQVFRFAVPALIAGNGALLKHASNVSGCALALEDLFSRLPSLPDKLFSTLLIGKEGSKAVVEHDAVQAVTLTGSEPAGRSVAEQAGRELKHSVMELGGSDPYLVLADADIDEAAKHCAKARLVNTGQSCVAAKRFIVVESVLDEFEAALTRCFCEQVAGDPMEEDTDIGPLARPDLRNTLSEQVDGSMARGASLVYQAETPEDAPDSFYPPSILRGVKPGMPVFDEETFGPVAAIIAAKDEAEAVALANRSSFGLGAAVFSRDVDKAERLASHSVDTGMCFVNSMVQSDPRLPFGGVRDSGYGRELAAWGPRQFVNAKTVYLA